MSSNTTPMSLDDSLVNGQTYTFQFYGNNTFINPSTGTISNDIVANAPDFITSLVVTNPDFSLSLANVPFLATSYNVQFTYEGDGGDVVSDVANAIIAAVQATSGDAVVFVGAVAAPAALLSVSPSQLAATAESTVNSAVNQVASDAVGTTTKAVNQALQGLLPLLIVVVAIILFVVPSFVKSTGVRFSAG